MFNTSHPGTTPHDSETASDLDSATTQAGTMGDWAASLAKLLRVAFREVDTDRDHAKASLAEASSLLRVQVERSSFGSTHNRLHLELDMEVRGQVEETLRASEVRWRTVFEPAPSPGKAKAFTLYMLKAVIGSRGDEVVSFAKTYVWRQ